MSTFTIHYFAAASTHASKNTESLPAPLPLTDLFSELDRRYPGIRDSVLVSCAVSVNGEYVDLNENENEGGEGGLGVIQAGDEVAIIPPVSSG